MAPPLFSLTERSKPNRIILIEQKCFVWKVQKRNPNQGQGLSFTEHYFITEPTRKICWYSVGRFPKLERNDHFSKCDWFMSQWNSPFVTANKPNKCFPLNSDPLKYKLQRAACFQLTTAHSGFGCCKTQNCVPQREVQQSQGHPVGYKRQQYRYTNTLWWCKERTDAWLWRNRMLTSLVWEDEVLNKSMLFSWLENSPLPWELNTWRPSPVCLAVNAILVRLDSWSGSGNVESSF